MQEKFMLKYLRQYDLQKIREQRIIQSFTVGRQLKYQENSDKRISKEIENEISGLCVRRPKAEKSSKKTKTDASQDTNNKSNLHSQAQQVFNSFDLSNRTDEFYQKFAATTLQSDITKDLKAKIKGKCMITRKNPNNLINTNNRIVLNNNLFGLKRQNFNLKEISEINEKVKRKKKRYCWRDIAIKRGYPNKKPNYVIEEPLEYYIDKILSPQPEIRNSRKCSLSPSIQNLTTETYSSYCKKKSKYHSRNSVDVRIDNTFEKSQNSTGIKIDETRHRCSMPRKHTQKCSSDSTTTSNVTRDGFMKYQMEQTTPSFFGESQRFINFDSFY